jgi:hypothetical protein
LFVFLLPPALARAQGQPFVRTSLSPRSVIVGQPVTLTVDVFVPTYFTGAPRFPPLEVKDAVVVFQETGGTNLNERVGEQEYAGQSRSYLVYPQRAGDYEVAPFDVSVRYAIDAKPSPRTPVRARGARFTATVPNAARGLEHFIASSSFELTSTFDRPLEGLKAGDSITRTITMAAADAFAMMLPPLSFRPVEGLAVYPAQPRVSDSSGERGATRVGTRVETVTYVLQKEGSCHLDGIEIDWWDTSAKTLRRARLPAQDFTVAPNPDLKAEIPLPADPSETPPPPDPWKPVREALHRYGPRALATLVAGALLWRLIHPRLHRLRERRHARQKAREESAAAYLERVRQAAHARPTEVLAATYRFLDRRGDDSRAAARLDQFAQASGDAALPALASSLVESALAGDPSRAAHASSERFVDALVRAAERPQATSAAPEGLGPLNPR